MSKPSDWLIDELPHLVAAGVLDEAAAARLRAHYANAEQGLGWGMILLAVGGAALIGLGIILIFASNWENWTPEVRVALSLLPLLAGQAACARALRGDSRLWSEGAGTFTALAIGASIALIAQTYQFGGDLPRFLLTWTLLALPLIYLLDSSAVAVLCWAGALGWALTSGDSGWAQSDSLPAQLRLWQFLLLASLPLPHLLRHLRRERAGARVAWMLRVAVPVLAIGYGASEARAHWDGLLLGFGGMAAAAMLAGRRYFSGVHGAWGNPLWSYGSLGVGLIALFATWGEVWDEVELPAPPVLILPALLALAAVWMARDSARQGDRLLPAAVAALPLALWIMATLAHAQPLLSTILGHGYLLALAAALIRCGLDEARLGLANLGVSLVAGLVLLRFFDSDLSYVLRGAGFIIAGLSFFIANLWLRRRLHARPA